ncbi:MAG: leucine-rich repeat domain-containing protein, partial [Muribaculaceae bacterium]|nr:leucine-rich repeat domain-containing protein [Muribaculaceae bacterium]
MIKRFAHTLLFFMSIQTVLHASAYNFESGGICYIIDGNARTASVANEKHSGPMTIPAFVTYYGTDYAVTDIDLNLFFSCEDLTSITVDSENRVYASVDGVLYNKDITVLIKCPEGRTSVEIPGSVTSIKDFAFYNCCNLTSITVDSENKAYTSVDGVLYDKDITELIKCPEGKTSVEIPNTVTTIGIRAFDDCHTLSSITVDSENKAYASADGVLYDKDITELITCPEGKTSVEIPGSVTIIANSAFDNCHTLSSITVDSENRAYASVDGVLYNKDITESIICPKGKTSVRIPDTMAKIRRLAFSDCDSLTSVEIPESVSVIG